MALETGDILFGVLNSAGVVTLIGAFYKIIIHNKDKKLEARFQEMETKQQANYNELKTGINNINQNIAILQECISSLTHTVSSVLSSEQNIKNAVVQLKNIKIYYLKEISDNKIKKATNIILDKFIQTLSLMLNNYTIDINALSNIRHDLKTVYAVANHEFRGIGQIYEDMEIREILMFKWNNYLQGIEDILTESANHYSDKIINLSFAAYKMFLQDMRSISEDGTNMFKQVNSALIQNKWR